MRLPHVLRFFLLLHYYSLSLCFVFLLDRGVGNNQVVIDEEAAVYATQVLTDVLLRGGSSTAPPVEGVAKEEL